MTRILVVEDDPAIARGLADHLEFEGYDVLTAPDGVEGYRMVREWKPDIIVLDLMLPRLSGFDVCRKIRAERNQTPILMLTARGEETDRVAGLDLGADDYVTKPFSIRELSARIRALQRRARPPVPEGPDHLEFADVTVDFRKHEAVRSGRPVDLTRKEFQLLRLLAARAGEVVSRDELLNDVWGLENYPTTRTVDSHVATLRAKLEPTPAEPRHIKTVHGVGYKFVP